VVLDVDRGEGGLEGVNDYDTFSGAWLTELRIAEGAGDRVAPRGQATSELRFRQFSVEDPMTFPVAVEGRDFKHVIGVLEGLSLVGQVAVPEVFTDRIKNFANFTDHGVFHGSYAARAHGLLGDLVELLERDPSTRQAVISVFDSTRDLNRAKRDIPCTIALHFIRRATTLELGVTMRSNDLWLGTPYDFTQFAIAQASVAQALGLEPGRYTHMAGSLHVYDRDVHKMEALTRTIPSGTDFPLWAGESTIAAISERARRLLLEPSGFAAETGFEAWAKELLTA
jgi:thymidylate synthase